MDPIFIRISELSVGIIRMLIVLLLAFLSRHASRLQNNPEISILDYSDRSADFM